MVCQFAFAQNNLKVATWNMSWFGSITNGPSNLNLQQQNAVTVFKDLAADIYAVCEVVDTSRLGSLTRSLGSNWIYIVSPMASNAFSLTSSGYASSYASAQKLAFVFDSSKLAMRSNRSMINATTFSNTQSEIRSWWSNGRFPYLLEAVYKKNSINIPLTLVLIHGKANVGTDADKVDSYNKRFNAINQLKDTLDNQFTNDNIILLGDFNDDLLRTIAPMNDTISSYVNLVKDSVGSQHYFSATLSLSKKGGYSVIGYSNIIDNIVTSSELKSNYIANSTTVHTEFISKISNYRNTTSDHLPVSIQFVFNEDLPNHVLVLNGRNELGKIKLSWQTNLENLISIQLQKSTDGIHFDEMDANLINETSFVGEALSANTLFYRIKALNQSGEVYFSNILHLSSFVDINFSLFPNPVKDKLYWTFNNIDQSVRVKIIASDGKVVKTTSSANNHIDISNLINGVYWIVFETNGTVLNRRFLKE